MNCGEEMPSVSLLERMLEDFGTHEAQFIEAKEFAKSIFTRQIPEGTQVISTEESYYVDHGIDHIERVVSKLNALNAFLSNSLSRKEAFIILVATYYHDIGMFIGRRQNEDPEQARREHHRRSAEVIQMLNDRGHLHIPSEELSVIKKVIEAHRLIDLTELPESQSIEGTEIRTQLLGAMLRIADACDCDRSRAPRAIFDLFYEIIPENSREYWRAHFPVTDVRFKNTRASIIVSIRFEEGLKERIEQYRTGNLVKKKLEEELLSVGKVFRYHIISLARVEIQDFDSGRIVDFSSFPVYETVATVILCSNFERVDDFVEIINRFGTNVSNGIPLVIEFRPPEGPLFVDTGVHVSEEIDEVRSALQETLGEDLWGVKVEAFEKTTFRRGTVS